MRVAVTGTPGTGKTTAVERLDTRAGGHAHVVHLNDVIREEGLHDGEDPDRASLYADFEALGEWLDEHAPGDDAVVVESHLAHHFDADRVVVLRCHPETLESRLRERGEPTETARENAEAEALDVILGEAVQRHGADAVYEIDTTDRSPDEVAEEVRAAVAGERAPSAGTVDFTGWL
ncbi:AAA family ATPase [Halomarina oriensis]|uniref:Putative adenylate kinase n=1 Tax=Halomarina oriensis TaxID=671145 RepID=A0A6B0GH25_9EURY|nr:AAA family ATPase [Halomarina oriensis]